MLTLQKRGSVGRRGAVLPADLQQLRGLGVTLHQGRSLTPASGLASGDLYCLLQVGMQKQRTRTYHSVHDPKWDQEVEFTVPESLAEEGTLKVKVLVAHYLRRDEEVAGATLPIASLFGGPWWCQLRGGADGLQAGLLQVSFAWHPEPPPAVC